MPPSEEIERRLQRLEEAAPPDVEAQVRLVWLCAEDVGDMSDAKALRAARRGKARWFSPGDGTATPATANQIWRVSEIDLNPNNWERGRTAR